MVVHMPEQRDIVVDVKTPLDAYLAAVEAQSDEERNTQLRRHAQIVGARVRELSSKQYWSQFERSPDFVVLFLPGDQFLSAALQENPGLIDDSMRQNIMLATPTSLIALLKVISYGWKQTVLADNAREVRQLGEELYKRLAVFGEHLGKAWKIARQQRRLLQSGGGFTGAASAARRAAFRIPGVARDARDRAHRADRSFDSHSRAPSPAEREAPDDPGSQDT